jgi:hypothetical protein
MADIRIKDLTTEAPNSLTGDFLPIDGGTGTRKLSAFSPSFGGNATVGGTLTVNGSSVGIGTATDASVGINSRPTITTGSFQYGLYSTPTVNASTSDSGFFSMITAASSAVGSAFLLRAFTPTLGSSSTITNAFGLRIENIGATGVTNAWGIDIAAQSGGSGSNVGLRNAGTTLLTNTTASTTTSSGALVVGNGTSGGLGVGGNAYIGGDLVLSTGGKAIYSQGYVTVKDLQVNLLSRGTNNGWTTGLHFYSSNTDYSATLLHNPGNGELQIYTNATSSNYTASDIALLINTSKQVQVKATTASTSTSSGALVVSGGVGVTGAIYAGGYLSTGNHARIGAQSSVVALSANNNVDGGLPAAWTGNYGVGVQYLGSSSNAFFIGDGSGGSTYFYTRTGSANTARLSIDNTNGNVTIGGILQVGNAYVGGAPTATGYIVIKDSTGTSYKIPAQAL